MVYITGDMHGEFSRFTKSEIKKLTKGDTLIVCGDFGFLWDGSKKEKKRLEKIGAKKYQVLFVPGCHDNYELLETYEESDWNGGRVRTISGNLRMLCRGAIFDIEGYSIFAFGGGTSEDTSTAGGKKSSLHRKKLNWQLRTLSSGKTGLMLLLPTMFPHPLQIFLKCRSLVKLRLLMCF